MVECGEQGGLALEPSEARRVALQRLGEHLDRHFATELRVPGAVHLAHPPLSERGEDLEGTEATTGFEAHG